MNPPLLIRFRNFAIHLKCIPNSSVSNVFFSKPYQLGPVTSFLVDRLPPLYLRMCFQKHHPTGGGHRWLRASTKEWLFGSVHNWELQNHWSWASWREANQKPSGYVVGDGDGGDDFVGCFFGGFMI